MQGMTESSSLSARAGRAPGKGRGDALDKRTIRCLVARACEVRLCLHQWMRNCRQSPPVTRAVGVIGRSRVLGAQRTVTELPTVTSSGKVIEARMLLLSICINVARADVFKCGCGRDGSKA